MTLAEDILSRFPVRKSGEEKQQFLKWAQQRLAEWGWRCRIEENGRAPQRNLVVGQPDTAPLLIVAHYDTPARKLLPNLILLRPVWFALYQLVNIAALLVLPALVFAALWRLTTDARLNLWGFVLSYLALLLLQQRGVANRHNHNASSGMIAALCAARALPPELRGRVAFLFTDHGECGHQGGKSWCKAHPQAQYTRFTLELGCLGVGEELSLISTSLARKSRGFGALSRLAEAQNPRALRGAGATPVGGDFRSFKCGAHLLYTQRKKGIGEFVPSLHTSGDTQLNEENLDTVTSLITALARRMGPESQEEES